MVNVKQLVQQVHEKKQKENEELIKKQEQEKQLQAKTELKTKKKQKLSFEERKDLWKENSFKNKEHEKCCKCHKKATNLLTHNEKNYCYFCWIKNNKKPKKQKIIVDKQIIEPSLDPNIYITSTKWENIK